MRSLPRQGHITIFNLPFPVLHPTPPPGPISLYPWRVYCMSIPSQGTCATQGNGWGWVVVSVMWIGLAGAVTLAGAAVVSPPQTNRTLSHLQQRVHVMGQLRVRVALAIVLEDPRAVAIAEQAPGSVIVCGRVHGPLKREMLFVPRGEGAVMKRGRKQSTPSEVGIGNHQNTQNMVFKWVGTAYQACTVHSHVKSICRACAGHVRSTYRACTGYA